MLRGSCLCQGVAFEIDGTVFNHLLYCHCSMCGKAHGSAFRGALARCKALWSCPGSEARSWFWYYRSSPGQHRGFCSVCGSLMPTRFDEKPRILGPTPAGAHDDPINRLICHGLLLTLGGPWETRDHRCLAAV